MNDKQLYKIWAPTKERWVDWVRPVAFMDATKLTPTAYEEPIVHYLKEYQANTAVFIDLVGDESIVEGITLSKLGYRPIPLFNGTDAQAGSFALVNTENIKTALVWGAKQLQTITIKKDAAPVFLLDKNRIHRHKHKKAVYDNSWDLYDQDIPTPETFKKYGIKQIIIHTDELLRDLKIIFYKFQKQGIKILITDGFEKPKIITIPKPPKKDKFH